MHIDVGHGGCLSFGGPDVARSRQSESAHGRLLEYCFINGQYLIDKKNISFAREDLAVFQFSANVGSEILALRRSA
jgi:hypothetical protein